MKLIIVIIFTTILINYNSFSDTLYKWTDEKGVDHYTNKEPISGNSNKVEKLKIKNNLSEVDSNILSSEDNLHNLIQEENENQDRENDIKEFWRQKSLSIEQEEEKIYFEIDRIKEDIRYLKKEIDYYLINGYSADFMIYELRYLESSLNPLYERLDELKLEMLQLKKEARKQGIPPGYLRP